MIRTTNLTTPLLNSERASYGSSSSDEGNRASLNGSTNRYTRVLECIVYNSQVTESALHKSIKATSWGLAFVVGMVGNLTFVNLAGEPACLEYGNGTAVPTFNQTDPEGSCLSYNEPYRWTLVVSNAASFGILTTWALLKLVNQVVVVRSAEEKRLSKPEINKCLRIVAKTGAVFLGVVSQIPFAFMAYKYNDNSIPFGVAIVASNFGYPAYSLDLTFQAALRKRNFSPFEKNLYEVKANLLACFQRKKESFLGMSREEKLRFADAIEAIETSEDSDANKLASYLRLFLESDLSNTQIQNSFSIKAGIFASITIGLFLSAMTLSHNWMGGYQGAAEITNLLSPEDNEKYGEAIRQSAAAFVTACSSYLTVKLISGSVTSIFGASTQIVKRKFIPPLSFQLMPTTTTVLKTIALGLAGTCWGAAVQFSRDYFLGNSSKLIEIGSSLANAVLVSTAMQTTSDEAVALYARKYGTNDDKRIIKVVDGIDNIVSKLNETSMRNFAKGLHSMINLLGDRWANDLGITTAALNEYLIHNEDNSSRELSTYASE
ncbi:MAG: hypothetical protein HKM07_05595 [Chlamydiae bacterium]|nr:hypothetical protein [Chlamydiota bacterium]